MINQILISFIIIAVDLALKKVSFNLILTDRPLRLILKEASLLEPLLFHRNSLLP
jgi:hypothetical protein